MRTVQFRSAAVPLSLASLLFASVAIAEEAAAPQPPKSPTEAFMKELDKNGDGQVSLDEVKAPQQKRFSETDADGDGAVSVDEARNAFVNKVPPQMMEEMKKRGMPDPGETFIQNLDSDGNKSVSPDEFVQPAVESFKRMDSNGDGQASSEEATAFFDEMQKEMQKRMQELQQQHQMTQPPAQQ